MQIKNCREFILETEDTLCMSRFKGSRVSLIPIILFLLSLVNTADILNNIIGISIHRYSLI